jgi:hypothetical protein
MFSPRGAEILFRITLAFIIAIESLLTVVHSLHSTTESHLGKVLPWFAGAEVIAALMLLIPQTVKIGGFVLLLIFLIALIIHGPAQQMPLFVYAAGVTLVMAAGKSRKNDPAEGGQ